MKKIKQKGKIQAKEKEVAYTIISQNNTTTTLQDENGNIIYVPGRVTLATSTDYTITEVNNNTATLTDGSGNVIRDVPCVVVLAGDGGGGGGSDQHNLGWYATESALTTAHPTASDGDYAIVGDTDTVWVWDGDTTAWVDSGAGGIGLPDQTGQSGKFLTTDGTDASWSDKPLVNNTTQSQSLAILGSANSGAGTAIGYDARTSGASTAVGRTSAASGYGSAYGHTAKATGNYSVAAGYHSTATGESSVAIGGGNLSDFSKATATGAIQIGKGTNNNAGTLSIGNANGNFEMMSADGTIPAARHAALPAADGTYTLQLVIANGVPTLSWVAV